jgi:hypothetical protein
MVVILTASLSLPPLTVIPAKAGIRESHAARDIPIEICAHA